ncbi:divergent protein kinase domain 2A isoform X2 [Musca autumnalis]
MRELSHLRLIILLTVALNTLDLKMDQRGQHHLNKFQEDLSYCPACFQTQAEPCRILMEAVVADTDQAPIWQNFLNLLPQRSCKRNNQLYGLKGTTTTRVMVKYFGNSKEYLNWTLNSKELKRTFLDTERLDGMQFYPAKKIENFVRFLGEFHKDLPPLAMWLYLLVNIQPLIMPLLYTLGFQVPETYGVCGFTIYQEYAGQDLYHFYNKEFLVKLKIAKHLLEACVKFSHGFDDYRLYITDLTADNVVYNVANDRLDFVDLDTLLVVSAKEAKYKSSTHRHEYIECPGCFAYSPDDIAAHNISDLNIYSACQFLSEDLYRDKTKGFLYPIPKDVNEKYPKLGKTLQRCVDCPRENCWERFSVAKELLKLIEDVLLDIENKT